MKLQGADARRLLAIQAVLVVAAGLACLVAAGPSEAQSALYGGSIALASAWLLQRRVRRAIQVATTHPGQETAVLYLGALQRFFMVVGLFALGMGWLELNPVPLLIGFGVAQLAFFAQRLGGGEQRAAG
jgi:ATP synthase protein I